MNTLAQRRPSQSLYAAAWKPVGTGIVVALMFLVNVASSHLDAPQMSPEANLKKCLALLHENSELSTHRAVRLELPVASLRDNNGQLNANAESFLLLLARRMKSLSLNVRLTSEPADTEFAATMAATMMRETPLDSMQLSISDDGNAMNVGTHADSSLTITIIRRESDRGEFE